MRKLTRNILLGVNVDHVATLRQARQTRYPDPIEAVYAAEQGGANGITIHLREDRRHIQERDVELIQQLLLTKLNVEVAVADPMLAIVERVRPAHCCLVPERREELTTEGGLNLLRDEKKIQAACERLSAADVEVALFIDPDLKQIEAALRCGAPAVELHTGLYAEATHTKARAHELKRIEDAAAFAFKAGLIVNAGHHLTYQNVHDIARIPEMNELNIGHNIIARALFVGLENAVREMKKLMLTARRGMKHDY